MFNVRLRDSKKKMVFPKKLIRPPRQWFNNIWVLQSQITRYPWEEVEQNFLGLFLWSVEGDLVMKMERMSLCKDDCDRINKFPNNILFNIIKANFPRWGTFKNYFPKWGSFERIYSRELFFTWSAWITKQTAIGNDEFAVQRPRGR